MRCVLIYNPASGRDRSRRAELVRKIANELSRPGHEVECVATSAPGSATAQAREAVSSGADVVFACGGDGTVHEVLQGLVCEGRTPRASLGIIPLGSANALARHMRLSVNPLEAALQQIRSQPQAIPVGKLTFGDAVRYFAVMAGAGPDGALVYSLLTEEKSRLGRIAYALRAARLFATRRFEPFEVQCTDTESGAVVSRRAVSAMAVRVGSLGGVFDRLTDRRAGIEDNHLQVALLSPPGWLSLPLWFFFGWLNLRRVNPLLRLVKVSGFSCRPISGRAAHLQADGEWLGRIPMEVVLVQNGVRVLMPSKSRV